MSLFSTDGVLYRSCVLVYTFILLSLLCLLASLPIVSVPPAVAAVFGVVRQYIRDGHPPALLPTYWRMLRENFRQSLLLGWIWACIGAVLIVDIALAVHLKSPFDTWIFAAIFIFGLSYAATGLYLFPFMVHTNMRTFPLIVAASKLALFKPHLTIANLLASVAIWLVGDRFPSLLVLLGVPAWAYITYYIADQKFKGLQKLSQRYRKPQM